MLEHFLLSVCTGKVFSNQHLCSVFSRLVLCTYFVFIPLLWTRMVWNFELYLMQHMGTQLKIFFILLYCSMFILPGAFPFAFIEQNTIPNSSNAFQASSDCICLQGKKMEYQVSSWNGSFFFNDRLSHFKRHLYWKYLHSSNQVARTGLLLYLKYV